MQFFYWLILLVVIGLAIFAIQNTGISSVTLKFFSWEFKTPLIFAILGSVGVGVLVTLFLWVPRAIKNSMHSRELRKKIENLEKMLYGPSPAIKKEEKPKEE
jgi:uncharacterized integral membrane protein